MYLIQPRLNYALSLKDCVDAWCSLFRKKKEKRSKVNDILGSENIYFFDNARSGLQLILSLLPVSSRVGVQPFTCHTVLEAIENAGCKVVFIDIDNHFVIDSQELSNHLNEFDALILTHTFGYPAQVDEIHTLLNGKMLIEDCAHAFLTKTTTGFAGSSGDFAIYSYGFAKFPSAIKGGYVRMNNLNFLNAFSKKVQDIAAPSILGLIKNLIQAHLLSFLNKRLVYTFVTTRLKEKRKSKQLYSKVSEKGIAIKSGYRTCQSVLENKLSDIETKLHVQQSNGKLLIDILTENESFEMCQNKIGMNSFMIPVLVENPKHFIEYAKTYGIEIGRHFVQSKECIPHFGYLPGSCPNYEDLITKVVTLPSHADYPALKMNQLFTLLKSYRNNSLK